MTIAENLFTFTNRNIDFFQLRCEGKHDYNPWRETIGKTSQKQQVCDKDWDAIEIAATKREIVNSDTKICPGVGIPRGKLISLAVSVGYWYESKQDHWVTHPTKNSCMILSPYT